MELKYIKELARKASNEALFDTIYFKQFSDDELVFFKDELSARKLEQQFMEFVKTREQNKSKIKMAVTVLPKERLFEIVIYNINKFSDEELTLFRNEIIARGLDNEFAIAVKAKEADDLEFKREVLDAPKDPTDALELMEKFNAYTSKKYVPKNIEKNNVKKAWGKSIISIILGALLLAGGVGLTAFTNGNMIFYGAIMAGLILIVRGILVR